MDSVINFLLESGVSLALLSLIYVVFLRRETFLRLNRVFLLFSLAFSVILPFLHLRIYEPQSVLLNEVTVTPYRNLLEAITVYGQDLSGTVIRSISSSNLVILIYLLGLLFFSFRFLFRVGQIAMLIHRHPVLKSGKIKFVLIEKEFSPFSFLSYVFIDPSKRNDIDYQEIVTHELEHIRQGHTFDVLILELLTILQWVNPFVWILKKVIRENHEFLADRAVLNKGANILHYKQLLLNQVVGFQLDMANNFNSSLIRKRIIMISKIKSSRIANLKYLAGALCLIVLVVIFACEQKETVVAEQIKSEQKIILDLDGQQLVITGDDAENQVQKLLRSGNYNVNKTEQEGVTYMNAVKEEELLPGTLGKNEEVFFIVEEMPEFPGGDLALRKFIANSVKYPEIAVENGIQGKVYVSFVVCKDGYVANAKIARGVEPSLDKEALRVVSSLPRWKPGVQRGQAVNVQYTVPINFVLQ